MVWIISSNAPRDIITGTDRKVQLSRFEGIPYSDLTSGQQEQLMRLLQAYIGNMRPEIADQQWDRI
ncbi:MAG: DUF3500 domain-containing protein, partial [Bacteroidia bacterium]|nr:DUF3500 domain-containing protein [Bacteroidia bacterium]